MPTAPPWVEGPTPRLLSPTLRAGVPSLGLAPGPRATCRNTPVGLRGEARRARSCPSSPAPSSVHGPRPKAGLQKRSIRLGCASGPLLSREYARPGVRCRNQIGVGYTTLATDRYLTGAALMASLRERAAAERSLSYSPFVSLAPRARLTGAVGGAMIRAVLRAIRAVLAEGRAA